MLKRLILPLGDYLKSEIYEIAEEAEYHEVVNRKQSQDFCFITNGAVEDFYKKELGVKSGPIIDMKGDEIGQHNGVWFYTIGQRKGLDLPGGPWYVTNIDVKKNAVIISKDEKDLCQTKEIDLEPINLIGSFNPGDVLDVETKTRSHGPLSKARLDVINNQKARLTFDTPPRAVTPGQYAVFYQGDRCLGGGKINL
jgi:tRNA-specific 2-thiouridylase